MVALAFFLGSDYTDGVKGVGIVNALEILQTFPMKVATGGPVLGMQQFKDWLDSYDIGKAAEAIVTKKTPKGKPSMTRKKATKKSDSQSEAESETEDEAVQLTESGEIDFNLVRNWLLD